jgi:hypothetical protein
MNNDVQFTLALTSADLEDLAFLAGFLQGRGEYTAIADKIATFAERVEATSFIVDGHLIDVDSARFGLLERDEVSETLDGADYAGNYDTVGCGENCDCAPEAKLYTLDEAALLDQLAQARAGGSDLYALVETVYAQEEQDAAYISAVEFLGF